MNETKPVSRQAGFLHNTHLDEVKLPCACRSLQNFMSHKNWSLERLSDAIGDDPRRLERVMKGDEPLGKTAQLALIASFYGLAPISRKD